jgi:hypothetical protein
MGVGLRRVSQVMFVALVDLDFARATRDLEIRRSDTVSGILQ